MKRLEDAEIIRGYHADINIARLASCLQFVVQIKLQGHTGPSAKQFEKAALKIPEIVSCQSVLGLIDYYIVIVAATVEKYQEVIAELRMLSDGEFDFTTFPVSKVVKSAGHNDLRQIVARLTHDSVGVG